MHALALARAFAYMLASDQHERRAMADIQIRAVTRDDIPLLLDFIRLLAVHEKRPDAVVATEEKLADLLFGTPAIAYGYLAFLGDTPVAYALLAQKYSSFRGIRILYIEDVLVTDAARGTGLGRRMMQYIAGAALEMGCEAMEWSALDYNTEALAFYEKLGGDIETGRLHYDMDLAGLKALAAGQQDRTPDHG